MGDVCLIFEVHQPLRLNRNFHTGLYTQRSVTKHGLFEFYFDLDMNRRIFERTAQKCYFPANEIILEQIDKHKREQKPFKLAYSMSGVFVEQCQRWNPDLLESFKQLAQSGCVEFLGQAYYHSLASLFGIDRSEFVEQVNMHSQLMKDLFDYKPRVVENTECLYNNAIAKTVDGMGFEAIITEGAEKVLGERSPNHVYRAKDSDLRVLCRNYRLSDDIGFRFTSTWWEEWPLTADKYASWLEKTPGQVVNIFMDYETFGEHYWPESGIHDFLRWLPGEVVKRGNLQWCTPSEVIHRHHPVGEIDVDDFATISWADVERDTSAWIGNPMQEVSYESLRGLEPLVKDLEDEDLMAIWRHLQISDHLYYMSTKGAGSGVVHTYFNPHGSAIEAFATYLRILSDFEARVLQELGSPKFTAKKMLRRVPKGKGFTFFYEFARPTPWTAQSLKEFYSVIKTIELKPIQFHMRREDFERWFRQVIGDEKLADELHSISKRKLGGEALRQRILGVIERRIRELEESPQEPTTA